MEKGGAMNLKDVNELKQALDKLGDKIQEDEKHVLIKANIVHGLFGDESVNAENYLSVEDTAELMLSAMALYKARTEEQLIEETFDLAIKVLEKQKNSPKHEESKIKYAEAGVDLDRYYEIYLKVIDEMKKSSIEEIRKW